MGDRLGTPGAVGFFWFCLIRICIQPSFHFSHQSIRLTFQEMQKKHFKTFDISEIVLKNVLYRKIRITYAHGYHNANTHTASCKGPVIESIYRLYRYWYSTHKSHIPTLQVLKTQCELSIIKSISNTKRKSKSKAKCKVSAFVGA
jgi:hypothetical protein